MRLGIVLVALLAAPAGCGSPQPVAPAGRSSPAPPTAPSGEILVFAAASLTDAFQAIGAAFERANPDTTVRFSFAGSQQLAGQILDGAPADVFASADHRQMHLVAEAGLVAGAVPTFAVNELVIAVRRGNPLGIRGLSDLAGSDLTLVMAAAEVPVGRYARRVLDRAGAGVAPASLESDVRAVLSKVELGEADAGIVYTSDIVTARDAVAAIPIAPEGNVVAHYPIARLADAPNPHGASAFVQLALSDAGQATLKRHGFASP